MRLINTTTLELKDHTLLDVPGHEYAILSHTWEDEEISYQEMISPIAKTSTKKGYINIVKSCMQAASDNLEWIWVDTCCIDKTSSAELTEAINSMYDWYAEASKCYVYLCDLEPEVSVHEQLQHCRWLTRGWTLQELLAPDNVEFFDMSWKARGSREKYIQVLADCTGISAEVLGRKKRISNCSVAARMSWASKRRTTRVEDMAYCLLGLFDVNMPLLYGERYKAFRRLQEEIIKRNSDLTILAWEPYGNAAYDTSMPQAIDLLATSPANFANGADIVSFSDDFFDFSVTNKGLFINGDFPLGVTETTQHNSFKLIVTYEIYTGIKHFGDGLAASICLRKIGPGLFCRDPTFPLGGSGNRQDRQIELLLARDCYIIADPSIAIIDMTINFRREAIYIPHDAGWTLKRIIPENLWDVQDRILLRPKLYSWIKYEMVIAVEVLYPLGHHNLQVIVLCDFRKSPPQAKIFNASSKPHITTTILSPHCRENSLLWEDFETKSPTIVDLTDAFYIRHDQRDLKISATFNACSIKCGFDSIGVFALELATDELPVVR